MRRNNSYAKCQFVAAKAYHGKPELRAIIDFDDVIGMKSICLILGKDLC